MFFLLLYFTVSLTRETFITPAVKLKIFTVARSKHSEMTIPPFLFDAHRKLRSEHGRAENH
jgi:hypothetical protein